MEDSKTIDQLRLIAYLFQHGDRLTQHELDLVLKSTKEYRVDPYSIPQLYLVKTIKAYEDKRKEVK